ncbi:MAG: SpoVG family protein, partial [Ruminococcus sp.]|nr:SpoVG family protein [Ruminococcus sp.]
AVHDIKVVQGDERLFVAMPSRKDENGVFRDIVHPISPDSRKLFEETILEAYERQIAMLAAEEAEAVTAE